MLRTTRRSRPAGPAAAASGGGKNLMNQRAGRDRSVEEVMHSFFSPRKIVPRRFRGAGRTPGAGS